MKKIKQSRVDSYISTIESYLTMAIEFPKGIILQKFFMMQGSSKASLFKLQQIMQKELNRMPKTPEKQKSLDLRHTIDCKPNHEIKTVLKKIQSLKSFNLDSDRKRESSLTSTRIAEMSQTSAFRSIGSADRLAKGNEIKAMKMGSKTKLKKKLSKQDSPKPFQKIKLRQTIEEHPESGNRQRREFTLKSPQHVQKTYLTPQEYEVIIEKQRRLIEQLQNIIEQWQDL